MRVSFLGVGCQCFIKFDGLIVMCHELFFMLKRCIIVFHKLITVFWEIYTVITMYWET